MRVAFDLLSSVGKTESLLPGFPINVLSAKSQAGQESILFDRMVESLVKESS
jgi:hypothetical protein